MLGSSGRNTRWKDVWNCINGFTSEFGVKEKDTIYFGMTEMEDHKLACVWVKEDE